MRQLARKLFECASDCLSFSGLSGALLQLPRPHAHVVVHVHAILIASSRLCWRHTHIRLDYNIVAIVLPSSPAVAATAACHMFAAKCCTIREAERTEAFACVCVTAKHLHNCQQQATCNWELATETTLIALPATSNVSRGNSNESTASEFIVRPNVHASPARACRACNDISPLSLPLPPPPPLADPLAFTQCLNYSMYVYHM